jgi:hypothetical protein
MKSIYLIAALLIAANSFSQKQRKISIYPDFHVNTTMYDRTRSSNSGGFGGGLQVFLTIKNKFRPSIEFNSDIFGGTKIFYTTADGKPIWSKSSTGNILIGSSYKITKQLYFNAAAGPSFYNSKTYITLKPTIGVYFPSSQLLVAKVSLTHVVQRDEISNQPFGVVNVGIGIKVF